MLDKYHWMLYLIAPAIWPRFLITLDEDLNALSVTARVGQVRDFLALSVRSHYIVLGR